MNLQRSLMALVAIALLAGLVPLALVLERRLDAALEQKVHADLEVAPRVLEGRFQDLASGRMMHARDYGTIAGLGAAVRADDRARAAGLIAAGPSYPGELPVLVGPGGESWIGPSVPSALVDGTWDGAMPVDVVLLGDSLLATVALAPIIHEGSWVGSAGLWVPVDMDEPAHLAALTRTDVLISFTDGSLGPYTGQGEAAMGLQAALVAEGAPPREGSWRSSGVETATSCAPLPWAPPA